MQGRGFAVAAVLVLAGAGCSSVEAAYLREEGLAVDVQGGFRFDDAAIEESFRMPDQLVFPMRIAVYGLESNRYGHFEDARTGDLGKALEGSREHFSDVLPLPDFLIGGRSRDVETLRKAAARAHADVLLLYEQEVDLDTSTSPLLLLNLAVLPCWLVPTTPFEVDLDTSAALVDVRNGVVYATARDRRTGDGVAPSASTDAWAKDVKAALREEAFSSLRDSLKGKLDRLRESKPAP
jgi:hypothetical protein